MLADGVSVLFWLLWVGTTWVGGADGAPCPAISASLFESAEEDGGSLNLSSDGLAGSFTCIFDLLFEWFPLAGIMVEVVI